MDKKIKVSITIDLDYIKARLWGCRKGIIEFNNKTEFEKFKEDPARYIKKHYDIADNLDTSIKDFEIDDYGEFGDIDYTVEDSEDK